MVHLHGTAMTRSPLFSLSLYAALGVGLMAVSGCATITQDECREGDWAGIGQRDGADGHAPSRIEEHARACSNFGITPEPIAYRSGWDSGVLIWCTPENGFATGRRNESYHGLCPASVAAAFLDARRVGERLGAAERRVASAEQRVRSLESEREQLRSRMESVRNNRNMSADARRDELDRMRDRISDIRWDMDRAQSDLSRARGDLEPAQNAASAFFAAARR